MFVFFSTLYVNRRRVTTLCMRTSCHPPIQWGLDLMVPLQETVPTSKCVCVCPSVCVCLYLTSCIYWLTPTRICVCVSARLSFQCRYSSSTVKALVAEVNALPPLPSIVKEGPIKVELRLANGVCITKGCRDGWFTFHTPCFQWPLEKEYNSLEYSWLRKYPINAYAADSEYWTFLKIHNFTWFSWVVLLRGCVQFILH